jgi:hypothetical protein
LTRAEFSDTLSLELTAHAAEKGETPMLNTNETNRLAELLKIAVAQQTPAQKKEIADLQHKKTS